MPEHSLQGLSVFILEDEYLIAMDVEQLCRDHGAVDVVISNTPPDLGKEDAFPFDIALLDVMLGGVSTMPFAEALHARGVPFIFTTGYADVDDKFSAFRAVRVVAKPYKAEELVEAIVEATSGARNDVRPIA